MFLMGYTCPMGSTRRYSQHTTGSVTPLHTVTTSMTVQDSEIYCQGSFGISTIQYTHSPPTDSGRSLSKRETLALRWSFLVKALTSFLAAMCDMLKMSSTEKPPHNFHHTSASFPMSTIYFSTSSTGTCKSCS